MLRSCLKFSSMLVLALAIVLTLRITLVTAIGYSYPPYLKPLKMAVISDYLYVVSALVLEMMLLYLSVALIFATTEWITVLYIPVLIYSPLSTYPSYIAYTKKVLNDKEMQNFLLRHWQNYVEKNDLFWFQIQHDLHCCGLEGPSTYLDYLRKVDPSCYLNGIEGGTLITLGCETFIEYNFWAIRALGVALNWLVLVVQLLILLFYIGWICQIYVNLIYPKSTRLRIYIYDVGKGI